MDFNHKSSPGGSRETDFGFAFNNRYFSDRVLRIEIVADPPESEASFHTLTECGAMEKCKRRLGNIAENENGDEAANGSGYNSNWSENGSRILRVETLHISSLILAAKSTFFYKLFTNGTMESKQRYVNLRINESEEAAVMELLNFMHSSTLRIDTAPALLNMLMAADKFEVASCMGHCSRVLRNLVLTQESALLYLNLLPSISRAEPVQPLMDAAKQFLAARYKDVSKHIDEVMNLPLVGIEAILSSDDLQVASEDIVYDMALKWTEIHYQNSAERRYILSNRLSCYIRFPYMSRKKLKEALTCDYLDKDFATKAVLDALFFMVDTPYRRRNNAVKDSALFVERVYKFLPIKFIEFELPLQHCIVYLDLNREECAGLFPSGWMISRPFSLGGRVFFLYMQCDMHRQCFELFFGVLRKGSATFSINCEFAARSKPLEEYVSMCKGSYNFAGGNALGLWNQFVLSIPWTLFMADDSPYFINGVMYLRAEFMAKRGPPT